MNEQMIDKLDMTKFRATVNVNGEQQEIDLVNVQHITGLETDE